jgi:membrane-bound inhibitor of C-type lysozyme
MSIHRDGHKPAEVTRVICASVSLVKGSVMDELFAIRNRVGGKSGRVAGVRGALLYTSGWFVFWLEGEQAAVEETVRRAAADPRNAHQKIIHRSRGPATLGEILTVASTQGADAPSAFARRVYREKEAFEAGRVREPSQLWRELSAPCSFHRAAGTPMLPDQHVGIVAASDNGPIDMLRKLGERYGSKVVYQRFASSKRLSADVGCAYVDVPSGQRVRRIQLLSRRAIGYRIVRQSLSCLDALLMMLGTRPEPALELASGVADLMEELPRAPAICFVGSEQGIGDSVGAMLRRGKDAAPQMVIAESELAEWLMGSSGRPVGVSG